jgi:hypothetical protein
MLVLNAAKRLQLILVLFLCVIGCKRVNDFSTKLPNGHELIRTNSASTMIWKNGGRDCVVPDNIVEIGVRGNLVIGRLEKPAHGEGIYNDNQLLRSIPGFFILDTSTGAVQFGLGEIEWLKAMEQAGIDEPHKMLRDPPDL